MTLTKKTIAMTVLTVPIATAGAIGTETQSAQAQQRLPGVLAPFPHVEPSFPIISHELSTILRGEPSTLHHGSRFHNANIAT